MNPSLPMLADHLWQSTLFAGVAGLLTLVLKKNDARVRYGVWLAASCKFLVPFSLLIALGGHVRWRPAPATLLSNLSVVIDEVSQPFAAPAISSHLLAQASPSVSPLPALLSFIWACGFLGIAWSWWVRWRRIRAAARAGLPVQLGIPIRAISSATVLEPGVCGIFRPILLLPNGIFDRLTPSQLKGVIAHELSHVRHWDNLIATIHMFVETVFWFHPLVWWIGKRMVAERERACDEEVLELGYEPRIYVEGILNVCKLYLDSPLECVSGISGSNLKQRVQTILANRMVHKMSLAKKVALGVAGTAALVIPLVIGIMNAPVVSAQTTMPPWQTAAGGKMAFEVASIRQRPPGAPFTPPNFPLSNENAYTATGGRFAANFPVVVYITFAYKLSLTQEQRQAMIAHLPKWVASDPFIIQAKAPNSSPTKDQMRLMVQSLLADRFQLTVHYETREAPVLALTLVKPGKTGPKLIPHSDGPPCDATPDPSVFPSRCEATARQQGPGGFFGGARNMTLEMIASALPSLGGLDRPVIDHTGLRGNFDYRLEWLPEPNGARPPDPAGQPDLQGTTFLQALHDQLGLKLEPTKSAIQTLVVDHIERPSEN